MTQPPFIVGIGGTAMAGSSTEQALALALADAEKRGASVRMFGGADLASLPHYGAAGAKESIIAQELVAAVRLADGVIIASPGYHGTISGLVKNAIDYIEETSRDERVYLDERPVGLIVTAYGWKAVGSTLATLRAIVHSLRGWPTPLGAGLKVVPGMFVDGACNDEGVAGQLGLVGQQVVEFAKLRRLAPSLAVTGPADEG